MAGSKKEKDEKGKKKGLFRKMFGGSSKDEVANTSNEDKKAPKKSFLSFSGMRKQGSAIKSKTKGKSKKKDKKAAKTKSKGKKAVKKSEFPPRKGKKPKFRRIAKEKKPRKVGTKKRDTNKFFPGDVSYKYTSPEEVWVEFLGRDIPVNDFGDSARIIKDETDK